MGLQPGRVLLNSDESDSVYLAKELCVIMTSVIGLDGTFIKNKIGLDIIEESWTVGIKGD